MAYQSPSSMSRWMGSLPPVGKVHRHKAALTKLKEINWLCRDVQPDKVEKSTDDLVIEVANSATSKTIEKVANKSEYLVGLQTFTVRSMDKHVPVGTDTDQYKMVHVAGDVQSAQR